MTVRTLQEAQEAIQATLSFIKTFTEMIGSPKAPPTENESQTKAPEAVLAESSRGSPSLMQQRVITILRDSGKPMSLKDLEKGYIAHGFPEPPSKNVYTTITACVINMKRRGMVAKNDDGYVLP